MAMHQEAIGADDAPKIDVPLSRARFDHLPSSLRPLSPSTRDIEQALRGSRSANRAGSLHLDDLRLFGGGPSHDGGAPENTLSKVTQDGALHKLLTEEKMRSEQHRTNYQVLKAEHSRLQSEIVQVQHDLSRLVTEKNEVSAEHARELNKLKRELASAQALISELRSQVLAPEKLDALQAHLQLETERPFRERLERLDAENESLRAECGKLKYDLAFLKSEYESLKKDDVAALDATCQQKDAEVANLRRERDELVHRLQHDAAGDLQKARGLQRDNAQLNQKVKSLLGELDEIREQRERLGVESDHVARLQQKQLVEFQANLKAVETEKDSLRKQCDSLMKELAASNEMQNELARQGHDLEEKSSSLKLQLETAAHRGRIELTEFKMEAVKQKGELEREKDRLLGQTEDLKCKVETLEDVNKRLEVLLVDKEQECTLRVNAVREEEFKHLSRIEAEKLDLESRMQLLDRLKRDAEERLRVETAQAEARHKEACVARDSADKEIVSLRTKLQQQAGLAAELEQERSQAAEQRARFLRCEADREALLASERELGDQVALLRQRAASQSDEARGAREAAARQQTAADRAVAQQRAVWQEERAEARARLDALEAQTAAARQLHADALADATKKKKQYIKLIAKLKKKNELAEAQLQEMQVRVESVKSFVPPETLARLKKELKDLKSRHHEYRSIMLSGAVGHVPIGERSFASANVHNVHFDTSFGEDEIVAQGELSAMHRRLNAVDANQRRQLAELVAEHGRGDDEEEH